MDCRESTVLFALRKAVLAHDADAIVKADRLLLECARRILGRPFDVDVEREDEYSYSEYSDDEYSYSEYSFDDECSDSDDSSASTDKEPAGDARSTTITITIPRITEEAAIKLQRTIVEKETNRAIMKADRTTATNLEAIDAEIAQMETTLMQLEQKSRPTKNTTAASELVRSAIENFVAARAQISIIDSDMFETRNKLAAYRSLQLLVAESDAVSAQSSIIRDNAKSQIVDIKDDAIQEIYTNTAKLLVQAKRAMQLPEPTDAAPSSSDDEGSGTKTDEGGGTKTDDEGGGTQSENETDSSDGNDEEELKRVPLPPPLGGATFDMLAKNIGDVLYHLATSTPAQKKYPGGISKLTADIEQDVQNIAEFVVKQTAALRLTKSPADITHDLNVMTDLIGYLMVRLATGDEYMPDDVSAEKIPRRQTPKSKFTPVLDHLAPFAKTQVTSNRLLLGGKLPVTKNIAASLYAAAESIFSHDAIPASSILTDIYGPAVVNDQFEIANLRILQDLNANGDPIDATDPARVLFLAAKELDAIVKANTGVGLVYGIQLLFFGQTVNTENGTLFDYFGLRPNRGELVDGVADRNFLVSVARRGTFSSLCRVIHYDSYSPTEKRAAASAYVARTLADLASESTRDAAKATIRLLASADVNEHVIARGLLDDFLGGAKELGGKVAAKGKSIKTAIFGDKSLSGRFKQLAKQTSIAGLFARKVLAAVDADNKNLNEGVYTVFLPQSFIDNDTANWDVLAFIVRGDWTPKKLRDDGTPRESIDGKPVFISVRKRWLGKGLPLLIGRTAEDARGYNVVASSMQSKGSNFTLYIVDAVKGKVKGAKTSSLIWAHVDPLTKLRASRDVLWADSAAIETPLALDRRIEKEMKIVRALNMENVIKYSIAADGKHYVQHFGLITRTLPATYPFTGTEDAGHFVYEPTGVTIKEIYQDHPKMTGDLLMFLDGSMRGSDAVIGAEHRIIDVYLMLRKVEKLLGADWQLHGDDYDRAVAATTKKPDLYPFSFDVVSRASLGNESSSDDDGEEQAAYHHDEEEKMVESGDVAAMQPALPAIAALNLSPTLAHALTPEFMALDNVIETMADGVKMHVYLAEPASGASFTSALLIDDGRQQVHPTGSTLAPAVTTTNGSVRFGDGSVYEVIAHTAMPDTTIETSVVRPAQAVDLADDVVATAEADIMEAVSDKHALSLVQGVSEALAGESATVRADASKRLAAALTRVGYGTADATSFAAALAMGE